MRIRSFLAAMIVAAVLPLALAAVLAIGKVREGERDSALDALRETVRAASLMVDREIQNSLGGLDMLAASQNLRRGDLMAVYAEAETMNQLAQRWTIVFDATGQQLINTQLPYGATLPLANKLSADWVAQVLRERRPLVTDLARGAVSGELVSILLVPGKGENAQYVVAHAYAMNQWAKMSLRPEGRPEWLVAVVDRAGRYVTRSYRAAELTGQPARPELVAAAATMPSGIVRHRTMEGVDVYDAFGRSELTGWTVAIAAPVASIEASARAAVTQLALGTLVALLAAAALAVVLGRRLADAVDRASALAGDLGEGRPVNPLRDPLREFRLLNRALVEASVVLSAERRSRSVAEQERERLLANERNAKLTAEHDNRRKDEFIAMLGHELRSPLAAIASAGRLLRSRGDHAVDRTRYVDVIDRQNSHLRRIVDDLLDVSRLMAGKIHLELAPVALHSCAVACVHAMRETEAAANYDLTADVEPVWVLGDEVRLEQVVMNLIANALKYSPSGGHIAVRVRLLGGHAVLSVEDDGMGIDAQMLERMFEPFVQGPALANRGDAGLGIGLALVKQLVQLHGGQVSAASPGPGHGSRFDITLPVAEVPEAASDPQLQAGPAPGGACRLLLVEDNQDARESMAELLAMEGYLVASAGDGGMALDALERHVFDLAVLDIGLPDMSGYDLAGRMRQLRPAMPLIALTGFGQERDKDSAAFSGFVAHLTKPVAMDDLLRTIARFSSESR